MNRIIFSALILLVLVSKAGAQLFNDDIYKLSKTLQLIDLYYVDTVDKPKIVETAIVEMLKELDPHSVYLSKEEVKKANEDLKGNFEGIGVSFNIMNDTLMVVNAISGGPSEKLGIMAGDRIVKIDGENVAGVGLTNDMVFTKLKGPKGTKVVVEILRKGEKAPIEFEIIRDKIPIFSLDASYMVAPGVGYIKLNRFAATTMEEFDAAAKKLKAKGAKNLILDLSGNGGGYLNMAHLLADEFLKDGQMIVFTEGRNAPREDLKATSNGKFEDGRLVVMVDEGSASASEIVSGAIQDWDRGVLVGRRSFGKGLVQRPFNLPDGSMMRLTVARYYTPTGRLIQKSYEEGVDAYHKDLVNRYNHGELLSEDSVHFPDSLRYKTLTKKRTVYGGGGIMPDIFVPIDTTDYSDYYRDLIRKGIINRYILTYVDKNRNELLLKYQVEKNPDKGFESFKANFNVDELLSGLVAFAEEKGVKPNPEQYERSLVSIKVNLKALVARDLWGTSEFFELINELDPIYREAVNVMNNQTVYFSKMEESRNIK